jgi:hypothetical protein
MKTLTVYCDKDLVFRWNEWPEKPNEIKCEGKNACDCAHEAFGRKANRDVVDYYDDNCPNRYNSKLELAKRESKPFEDQKIIQLILQTMEGKVDLSPFKPDTFYSFPFEGKVEVIEVPEYPIDHTSYPPMIKVAKLNPRKHP